MALDERPQQAAARAQDRRRVIDVKGAGYIKVATNRSLCDVGQRVQRGGGFTVSGSPRRYAFGTADRPAVVSTFLMSIVSAMMLFRTLTPMSPAFTWLTCRKAALTLSRSTPMLSAACG